MCLILFCSCGGGTQSNDAPQIPPSVPAPIPEPIPEPEDTSEPSAELISFYEQKIATPVVQSRCIACHTSTGLAKNSGLILHTESSTNSIDKDNAQVFYSYAATENGPQNLKDYPRGLNAHPGENALGDNQTLIDDFNEFIDLLVDCTTDCAEPTPSPEPIPTPEPETPVISEPGTLDTKNLYSYSDQEVPLYITQDNSGSNFITNEGATLGRVLFYDKKLSLTNTVSCASCHQQDRAFSDQAQFSEGIAGETARHSPRLVNARFAEQTQFRWHEDATLEEQTIKPIRDAVEMGYSGEKQDSDFSDLIKKLEESSYYPDLFTLAYGDPAITENRMSLAMAQFIRSIQSFDTKYDTGLAQVNNHNDDFPNFTAEENAGKNIFTEDFEYVIEEVTIKKFTGDLITTAARRTSGGLNCASCHRPPEFDMDPNSLNNGFDRAANNTRDRDFSVTRSPTLRDLIHPDGEKDELNSPIFHGGTSDNLIGGILANYDFKEIHPDNDNLDSRMAPEGFPAFLNMTNQEQNQLAAFLNTLTGSDVYTNKKWSDPFDEEGNITLIE